MLYNSKMMEIDPRNKFWKLSKSLYLFTASVMFYCPASARSIIVPLQSVTSSLYPFITILSDMIGPCVTLATGHFFV